jgi:hypothetical protein
VGGGAAVGADLVLNAAAVVVTEPSLRAPATRRSAPSCAGAAARAAPGVSRRRPTPTPASSWPTPPGRRAAQYMCKKAPSRAKGRVATQRTPPSTVNNRSRRRPPPNGRRAHPSQRRRLHRRAVPRRRGR